MAVYCKPSYNEPLTVFNPSNWICGEDNSGTSTSGGITLAYANANFLKFPSAQGNETLVGVNVLGTSQFNGTLNEFANTTDFNGTTNFNSGIKINTGTLRFPDTTIQTTAYTGAPGVASSVVVASGGSGVMYLALTQGTGGNYPILTNLPQYNATSAVLSAPIFNGTSYITSPLLTTTPNGTLRVASTTGQYSYFQQSSAGGGYDLDLVMPPNNSHLNIFGGGQGTAPLSSSLSGLSIGWDTVASSGASDYINYAQGGNGGHNFWTLNSVTNATLIGTIPRFQPAFNDSSTTNIPTNNWVQGAITNGGFAKIATANTFTAQNIFNNFCPQTPVAPTVNNSLVNLQYLNSVLTTNGIQNYNLKNPTPYNTTQNNSTFNSIKIAIPQSQFTSSAPPYKALKIRFNYVLTGNSNNLMISNSGILNIYPLNTTSNTTTPNYSYVGSGGAGAFANPPNEYKYNITNNMYTSSGTLSNAYNALYTDDFGGISNLKRWYYVSNINGGSPSGVSGTPYFSYLSYTYDGAGNFYLGFTTPPSPMPATSNPTYTGDPGYGTASQLNLNIFMEVVSNDFVGSVVSLQYTI